MRNTHVLIVYDGPFPDFQTASKNSLHILQYDYATLHVFHETASPFLLFYTRQQPDFLTRHSWLFANFKKRLWARPIAFLEKSVSL